MNSILENVKFYAIDEKEIKPDDIIVLKLYVHAPEEHMARLKSKVERYFPGHKVMVLSDGVELMIARKENE